MRKNTYHHKDVEVKNKQLVYDDHSQLWVYQLRHRRFDGEWSNLIHREVYQRPNSAGMLLYDPSLDKVVLIEQFRAPVINYPSMSPWLLEVPAGLMKDGEDALSLSIRETEEETGLTVDETVLICDFFPSPGGVGEYSHLFCGKVDANQANGIHGLSEENEDIKVHVFTSREVFKLLKDGDIKNAYTIIAVQWLRLNKRRLCKLWGAIPIAPEDVIFNRHLTSNLSRSSIKKDSK